MKVAPVSIPHTDIPKRDDCRWRNERYVGGGEARRDSQKFVVTT